MTDPSDSRSRRPTPIHTVATDAPSYFTSQSLRRPSSLRQSSTPSPQQAPTSRPSSSRQASTSITSDLPTSNPKPSPPSLPDESTMRPRPFTPLFTLVTDTTGSKPPRTHHPRVHYIFSDDEDDEAFAAALASHNAGLPDSSSAASVRSGQPSKDRSIVLDLIPRDGEAGYDVRCASSLGSDWAVTNATISRMEGEGPAEGEGAFMLKIEGVGIDPGPKVLAAGKEETMEYAQMMDQFEQRMVVLRKVVSALDEKSRADAERDAVAEADEGEEDEEDEEEEDDEGEDEDGDEEEKEASRPSLEEEAEDLRHDTG